MSGSGDHPSGSRGWNHDWFGSEPFPSPEMQFSAPPQTQGSQVPGGYRPYPVNDQNTHDGRYGWAPKPGSGGSGNSAPTPTSTPTTTHPTRGTHTLYTPDEMMQMFKAYLAVSEIRTLAQTKAGKRFGGASLVCTMKTGRREPSIAMIVWCTMPSSEPTTQSVSSRGITSRKSGRRGAARASSTSSVPPWRPTNP